MGTQQCTMSRADEGAAFTCSWRDRLTGRETLWGNKGVPKTKEGHNQSQIPLRTSLPPIGAESPGVQVALSTNSVSVSRAVKLFWSAPKNTYGNLSTVKVGNELINAYCLQRKNVFRIKEPECFIDRSTQVHRKLCVTRASLRDQDSLSAGHLEWNSNVKFFPHDSPPEGTCNVYIISSYIVTTFTYLSCLCVGNTKSEVEKSFLHKQWIQLGFAQEQIHCGSVGSMSGGWAKQRRA